MNQDVRMTALGTQRTRKTLFSSIIGYMPTICALEKIPALQMKDVILNTKCYYRWCGSVVTD